MRKPIQAAVLLACLAALAPARAAARPVQAGPAGQAGIDEMKKAAVKVFLDCDSCDLDFIKTEITFVNYVRDRLEAQVHVLVSTQSTGGGGVEYTITFIGQNDCSDLQDVQKCFSSKTDTEDEIRRGLVKALKLGLMSFVARTPIAGRIAVDYARPKAGAAGPDRWRSWVFSLSGNGYFSGEETYLSRSIYGSFSANRVTPRSKLKLGLSVDASKQRYETEDGPVTGKTSSQDLTGLFVRSLGEHWSVGAYVEIESSLYSNIDIGFSLAPAVEYNFFPYSQSSRRQLRALYKLSLNPVRYREATIFGKLRETLFQESLSLTLDLREKLGTISLSVEASNYLHDLGKYRVDTFAIVNLRLYKGLSVYVIGDYSWIHDQLSLLGREATYEELLLRLRELPMSDNYFAAIGFQFQFGSIFTNVINPRFGSSGGGGLSIKVN
ncbi:MAG TPA: hypothetical protein P5119_02800 [Candidatus Aminicenantes bacterium]|nr:hypothetical protein [Candidatus Aminicenantes bacterium]HRY64252.1 hypothetical protein [Candidatus Aminicenantes bacterium]HRZ71165.1 hypothetical protein [Candidatus Aminicenantes bacterium]